MRRCAALVLPLRLRDGGNDRGNYRARRIQIASRLCWRCGPPGLAFFYIPLFPD